MVVVGMQDHAESSLSKAGECELAARKVNSGAGTGVEPDRQGIEFIWVIHSPLWDETRGIGKI
jgi:hypothetical protein